jgi:hypothetical protein
LQGLPFVQRIGNMPNAMVLYRDLVSAGLADLWSVTPLINLVSASAAHRPMVAASPLLSATPTHRTSIISQWLQANPKPWQGPGAAALQALSSDPPLPFFILLEAFVDPASNGCRLGTLGSIIVAESLFGELYHNQLPAEQRAGGLVQRLQGICNLFVDPGFAAMNSMRDVIAFVWSRLQRTNDPAMTTPPLV